MIYANEIQGVKENIQNFTFETGLVENKSNQDHVYRVPNETTDTLKAVEPTDQPPTAETIEKRCVSDERVVQPFTWTKVASLSLVILSSVLGCTSIALAKQLSYLSSAEIGTYHSCVSLGLTSLWVTFQGTSLTVPRDKVGGMLCSYKLA